MSEQDETKIEQVPPHETTASPVELAVATPRYFGVTPPTLLFGVASATLALAIVFAVLAHWLAAAVLAVAVLVEIALFLGVAGRKPDTALARGSVSGLRRVRERGRWLVEATSVRTEAGRRLTGLRHELLQLGADRDRSLRDLGAAVYEGDDDAAKRLQERLRTIDEETRRKEGQMGEIAETAQERLQQGRLGVQPTEIRRPEDEA